MMVTIRRDRINECRNLKINRVIFYQSSLTSPLHCYLQMKRKKTASLRNHGNLVRLIQGRYLFLPTKVIEYRLITKIYHHLHPQLHQLTIILHLFLHRKALKCQQFCVLQKLIFLFKNTTITIEQFTHSYQATITPPIFIKYSHKHLTRHHHFL